MLEELTGWIQRHPKQAAVVLPLFGVIAVSFLNHVIWPAVRVLAKTSWRWMRARLSRQQAELQFLRTTVQEHRFLPALPTTLIPVMQKRQRELDAIYVDLAIRSHGRQPTTLAAVLAEHSRIVLLGEPGAGKTTMLRFLALTLARARADDNLLGADEADVETPRVKFARRYVRDELRLHSYPLPVFGYLNRLLGASSYDGRDVDVLLSVSVGSDAEKASRQLLDRAFKDGHCFYLFDAFDELSTSDARDSVARQIGALASRSPAGTRFIVSSRLVGYSGQLAEYGFAPVSIEPLSDALIERLLRSWYGVLENPAAADRLLANIRSNDRTRELAVNPMMLSLLALLQHVRDVIPKQRHLLYDECITILLQRGLAPALVRDAYDAVLPWADAKHILAQIALQYHLEGRRDAPKSRVVERFLPAVLRGMSTSSTAAIAPADILDNVELRSQLLVDRGLTDDGDRVLAFSHLTFQEYLAASALWGQVPERGLNAIVDQLLTLYDSRADWWREVALLFAAHLEPSYREAYLSRLGIQVK